MEDILAVQWSDNEEEEAADESTVHDASNSTNNTIESSNNTLLSHNALTLNAEIIQKEIAGREILALETERQEHEINQRISEKIQREQEIEELIKKSITQGVKFEESVALFIDKRLIIVSNREILSDNLREYIWGVEKPYNYKPLKHLTILNELATTTGVQFKAKDEVWGIIAVKYESLNTMTKIQRHQRQVNTIQTSINNKVGQTAKGLYLFTDSCLLMIRNNQIIDYSIWGVHSNFNEMIARHKPTEIFYNANVNDPTWCFLNFKSQPYYNIIQKYGRPMRIYRDRNYIITVALCDRLDICCALCNAIKDFLGLTRDLKMTIRMHEDAEQRQREERAFEENKQCWKSEEYDYHRRRNYRYNPYKRPVTFLRHSKVPKINNGRMIL